MPIQNKILSGKSASLIQIEAYAETEEDVEPLQVKRLFGKDSSIKGEAEGKKCEACPEIERWGLYGARKHPAR